jgi:hypothetical protein
MLFIGTDTPIDTRNVPNGKIKWINTQHLYGQHVRRKHCRSAFILPRFRKRDIKIKEGCQKKGGLNYNRMHRIHALLQVTTVATVRAIQEVREKGR